MPDTYYFRVQGHLGSSWSDWFEGLTIICDPAGETLLSGPVEDQAALYGILAKLRNLNLALIAVYRAGAQLSDFGAECESSTHRDIRSI